jgi:hypothetical protein
LLTDWSRDYVYILEADWVCEYISPLASLIIIIIIIYLYLKTDAASLQNVTDLTSTLEYGQFPGNILTSQYMIMYYDYRNIHNINLKNWWVLKEKK